MSNKNTKNKEISKLKRMAEVVLDKSDNNVINTIKKLDEDTILNQVEKYFNNYIMVEGSNIEFWLYEDKLVELLGISIKDKNYVEIKDYLNNLFEENKHSISEHITEVNNKIAFDQFYCYLICDLLVEEVVNINTVFANPFFRIDYNYFVIRFDDNSIEIDYDCIAQEIHIFYAEYLDDFIEFGEDFSEEDILSYGNTILDIYDKEDIWSEQEPFLLKNVGEWERDFYLLGDRYNKIKK